MFGTAVSPFSFTATKPTALFSVQVDLLNGKPISSNKDAKPVAGSLFGKFDRP